MPTTLVYVQVTGWLSVGLLVLLLYRAVVGKTIREYPLFYCYAAQILVSTIVGLSVRWPNQEAYRLYYWISEAVTSLLSMGVTWEIHRRILASYPGVRRLAGMLLSIIFVLVLLVSATGRGDTRTTFMTAERDLRTVQAIILLILFALVAYYAIPLSRNIRGIAIGYIFGVATSVINLTLRNYLGDVYIPIWKYGRGIEFLAGLVFWCVTLWSYQRDSDPPNEEIEQDYEWVSGQAVQAMVRLRTHLIHPDRS